MQETINMEVTSQGGNKYTVVMDKKDIKVRKCFMKKTIFFCILYGVTRIIIVGLIVACLGFSIRVFNSMKNYEPFVSETTTPIVECDQNNAPPSTNEKKAIPATDDTNLDNNRKRHRSPHHGKVVQKRVNWYPVFGMTYFVVLAGTVVALIVLLAKDDSWFRCAKLDELHVIREKFFAGEVNDSANKTETNKTTTTEITDQRAELLKHYMNCVADI